MMGVKNLPGQRSNTKIQSFRAGILLVAGLFLASCQGGIDSVFPKADTPIPPHLIAKMNAKGMSAASPIMMRIFKLESELEVWKLADNGKYQLLESYEICKWSGKLGPKFKEGDRQAPEGFYSVGKAQLNPRSQYHLSFNLGFPNVYDRAHGRTGSHLMVHGACSSAGCYSMTDELVEEIYALAREALKAGQGHFQVQAFPFRMTPANLAKHADSEHFEFWTMLKEGYDHFEITKAPPKVDVCDMRYVFNRTASEGEQFVAEKACPTVSMPERLLLAYSERLESESQDFKRALKREHVRATLKGEPFAALEIDRISLRTPGAESVIAALDAPAKETEPGLDVNTDKGDPSGDTERDSLETAQSADAPGQDGPDAVLIPESVPVPQPPQ